MMLAQRRKGAEALVKTKEEKPFLISVVSQWSGFVPAKAVLGR